MFEAMFVLTLFGILYLDIIELFDLKSVSIPRCKFCGTIENLKPLRAT